jgi:hypothetical protein
MDAERQNRLFWRVSMSILLIETEFRSQTELFSRHYRIRFYSGEKTEGSMHFFSFLGKNRRDLGIVPVRFLPVRSDGSPAALLRLVCDGHPSVLKYSTTYLPSRRTSLLFPKKNTGSGDPVF